MSKSKAGARLNDSGPEYLCNDDDDQDFKLHDEYDNNKKTIGKKSEVETSNNILRV